MWIIIILLITAPFFLYGSKVANIEESCVVVKVGNEGQRCDISSVGLNTAQKAEFGSPEVSMECNPSTNPEVNRLLNKYFKSCEEVTTVWQISQAESSGNHLAVNKANRNKSVDAGWLQLNSIHRNKNESIQEFTIRMFNLEENIKLASKVYKQAGNKFTPWVTFNKGLHEKYLANK